MIDAVRLAAWLDGVPLPGAGEPAELRLLSGGTQNEIYEIRRGQLHAAVRIPPINAPADRDRGILREWRILQALADTDVPHARALAVCNERDVLGRPFYVMEFVDGWSPLFSGDRWPEPFHSDQSARAGLGYQLAEGIALLAGVDWQARGLGDLGRPEGFHERQVERWSSFFDRIRHRELVGYDVATAWLGVHRPLDYTPGLMHGDYQFANVMFCHGAPARLAALVDWEMGTVGDPKLDLAWMVHNWPEDTSGPSSGLSYVDLRGLPGKSEIVRHYAAVSGRQVDDLDYYEVLAKWKLAIVLEQGYQRAGTDAKLLAFGPIVTQLMIEAAELAESTDYRGSGS